MSERKVVPEMQTPDRLAQEAAEAYGRKDFAGALDRYADAIDQIHRMCVVAPLASRVRTLGAHDQATLDGFSNSLEAALAADPQLDVATTVQRTLSALAEIALEAGPVTGRYVEAARRIESTYRLSQR